MLLREAGYDQTIYVHGALQGLNALYEKAGVMLGPTAPATTDGRDRLEGKIVIAPPLGPRPLGAPFCRPAGRICQRLDAGAAWRASAAWNCR